VSDTLRASFLGLGAMGLPMARNIARAGFPLTVWNRTASKMQELGAKGARVAATPREAAAAADVILICVPSSDEVRDVLTRTDGVFAGAARGSIVVDCSTIDPNASRSFHALAAERGLHFLEAPLSGGTMGAAAGTLTLMVGGDAATLERALPVLKSVGKNIFHLGGPGAGQTTKLCNQMIFAAQMVAVAEAYALLGRAGIDPKLATDVFAVSSANCTAVAQRVPIPGLQPGMPASEGWKPGFATEWMAKDLHLAEEFARSLTQPVMQVALDHQIMRMAMRHGYAKLDISTVGKMMIEDWTEDGG